MANLKELDEVLKKNSNAEKAKLLSGFFKTGKGEYGEGDIFLGITVPVQREIAQEFEDLGMGEIQQLLDSKVHEKRMIALFILVDRFNTADEKTKKETFDFYLKNTQNINNWDLVDLSAPKIVGEFLIDRNREILRKLAKSEDLWGKRIAIISTYAFIRENDFKDTLKIAEILINDKHDLIHKGVGWMLREVGKRDEEMLIDFLDKNHRVMPRTMLRYAIEKFDEGKRKEYLNKERL